MTYLCVSISSGRPLTVTNTRPLPLNTFYLSICLKGMFHGRYSFCPTPSWPTFVSRWIGPYNNFGSTSFTTTTPRKVLRITTRFVVRPVSREGPITPFTPLLFPPTPPETPTTQSTSVSEPSPKIRHETLRVKKYSFFSYIRVGLLTNNSVRFL